MNPADRRSKRIKEVYRNHGALCTCPGCSGERLELLELPTTFIKVPASTVDDFLRMIYQGQPRTFVHPGLYREYYYRLRQWAELGLGERLNQYDDFADLDLKERLKRNTSTFAGFKAQAAAEDLRALNKLPLPKYLEEGRKLMGRYNGDYLSAELETMATAANSAKRWRKLEERAFLYPNLKYLTVGDERVRESHKALHGAIYPVHHPFWDKYMPPNGWRCRCIVLSSDEEINSVDADVEPPRGFRNNPGKSGKLIEEDHPYFDVPKNWAGKISRTSEQYRAAMELAQVTQAAAVLAGKSVPLPGQSKPALISGQGINNALSATHIEQAIKNDLIAALALVLPQLSMTATGEAIEGLVVYVLEMAGAKFYFQFEMVNGVATFKTVSEGL